MHLRGWLWYHGSCSSRGLRMLDQAQAQALHLYQCRANMLLDADAPDSVAALERTRASELSERGSAPCWCALGQPQRL